MKAQPEFEPADRRIMAVLFVLTAAYLLAFRRYVTIDPDEGIILQGAERILRGEVLYRDFFSFFTPGSYYLLALLFKLFGNSLLVARSALVVFGAVFSCFTYVVARRVSSQSSALAAAAIVSLTCLPYRFMALHNWDSTFWACFAVYGGLRLIETQKPAWGFVAGSFTSLTFLFEQSKGGGLAAGLVAGFCAIHFAGRKQRVLTKPATTALIAGAAWPMLATMAWFGARHALEPMIADWLWPLDHYSLANRVVYGSQDWSDATRQALFSGPVLKVVISVLAVSPLFLVPFLPLVAIALFAYWMVQMRRQQADPKKSAYYLFVTAALSGLLLSVIIVRADIVHFMYIEPFILVVLAWIFDGRDIPGRIFPKARPAVIAYTSAAFFCLAFALLVRSVAGTSTVATARGEIAVTGKDGVAPYVNAHTTPGETALVYPYLPLYYYLTGTFSPGPFDYLQPGLHTPQQQQEMLEAISKSRVRVVLFEYSFAQKIPSSWPNTPISAIIKDPIRDYILANYRTCTVLHSPQDWPFLFMIRKDLACPR